MTAAGSLSETSLAAVQHDLVDLPADATTVGVVRRPTRWFSAAVDENRPALAPPETLLDEFRERREDFKLRGLCDDGAHNAAWDDVGVEDRYREHLAASAAARRALDDLADRLRGGEDIALVCYENPEKKRCHRTILEAELGDRL